MRRRSEDYDEFDGPSNEEMEEYRNHKRYIQLLDRHPDCRDPDHPGCSACNDNFNDEEE